MTAAELAKKIHETHGAIHNRAVAGTEFERVTINWLSEHPLNRRITTELAEWIIERFIPKESPENADLSRGDGSATPPTLKGN